MKVYTKTGDKGTTALIGGVRVPKHHLRIETYGTVDEMNSYIGLIRDVFPTVETLALEIQDRLFTLGSLLAEAPEGSKMELPQLHNSDIEVLEKAIDKMETELPPLKSFVLPGGNPIVSHIHIARCVCRRAERLVSSLSEVQPDTKPIYLQYLNRLSDYLFVLSRFASKELNAKESPWTPRM
jgi:cob(I)alamin adenosyltransferase